MRNFIITLLLPQALQSEQDCVVLPPIFYFLPIWTIFWICSSIFITVYKRITASLSLWDSIFPIVLSALSHKLSSFLGKRCDPLGKEQIDSTLPPVTVLQVKTLPWSSHGTVAVSCLMSYWGIRLVISLQKNLQLGY